MTSIDRYNCTYSNDFVDSYPADKDYHPKGEFVFYDEHEEIVFNLEKEIERLEAALSEAYDDVEHYKGIIG